MKREKFDIISVLLTILLHGLAICLLLVLHLNRPVAQAESGVPVMLGNMGNLDTDYEFTEVNSMPAPAPAAVPVPKAPQAEPAITQNMEETVAIESGEKEKPVKPAETPKQPTPEEIRAEQERQAAEQAQSLMANAFGRSSSMQASASQENTSETEGTPGSTEGNATQGKPTGVGSYGNFDLGGRDMLGALPRPAYEGIQDEGRVVVAIVVSPEGKVVSANVSGRTSNTTSSELRKIAVEAALKARFNPVDAVDNQIGSITYYFKLK